MSVYTAIPPEELADWLQPLALGTVDSITGIAAGVENTNYFLTTRHNRWVLTIFERLAADPLDFYLGLMAHLADRGLPCPRPQPCADRLWRPLAGKPAALFNCLPGHHQAQATASQCRRLGQELARLHRAAADYSGQLANPRGAAWRQSAGERLLPHLPPAEQQLLADELAFQAKQDTSLLPSGIIHADLFRDNVLWQGSQLSGLLDFYFAGWDTLLFDLAVTANDWCQDKHSEKELLAGYASERPLTDGETAAWPALRRAAALRFWLSRLDDLYHPRPGEMVTVKDPAVFRDMLTSLR